MPLLIGGDLERGASMRLDATTMFPHAMAFTAGGDPDASRVEGEVTAREARAVGITWVFYPVVDVNSNPDNPIINIRSFGENPEEVAKYAQAFIEGAHSVPSNYVLTTAKHFPGHGDTATDTHINLATINSDRQHLDTIEFVPFRAAIAAGVDSIMTAHLAVPALEAPDLTGHAFARYPDRRAARATGFQGNRHHRRSRDGRDRQGLQCRRGFGARGEGWSGRPADASGSGGCHRRRGGGGETRWEIDRKRIQASVRRLLIAKVRVDLDIKRHVDLKKISRRDQLAPENVAWSGGDRRTRRHAGFRNEGNLLPLGRNTKACFVAMVESHNGKEGDEFADQLHQIVPSGVPLFAIAPNEAKTSSAAILGTPCDSYVVAAWVSVAGYRGDVALGGDFPDLLNSIIATGKPVALISLGNPYIVRSFAGVKAYMTTFSTVPPSETAAVKALFGLIPITGRLPVSIPGIAAYHSGLRLP